MRVCVQVRFRSYLRDFARVSVLAFLCEHAGVLAYMCVGDCASSRAFVCVQAFVRIFLWAYVPAYLRVYVLEFLKIIKLQKPKIRRKKILKNN